MRTVLAAVLLGCLLAAAPAAELPFLHPLFAPHAVLQQGRPIPVWGWTTPGTTVRVRIADQDRSGVADKDGRWQVEVGPFTAGGAPLTMQVDGPWSVTVDDLLIGEVWLCAGQSNMFWFLNAVTDAEHEIAQADHPTIRLFSMLERSSASPLPSPENVVHHWAACIPGLVGNFSAVAYYFGRELQRRLDVPVGLINCSYGGTTAECWMDAAAVRAFGGFDGPLAAVAKARNAIDDGTFDYGASQLVHSRREAPTLAANGMLLPLAGFPIAGVVWYQGESNANRAEQYRTLLPALIADWRGLWHDPRLPFVIVQLAGFGHSKTGPQPADEGWAGVMAAQSLAARTVPGCGLACAYDQGDADDVHPKVKKEVGRRIVYPALAVAYGRTDVPPGGPVALSAVREGAGVRVRFGAVGTGLEVRGGGGVTTCALSGVDGRPVWATAVVAKDSLLLTAPGVTAPTQVQFACDANPPGELYNSEGLPAVPFRLAVK